MRSLNITHGRKFSRLQGTGRELLAAHNVKETGLLSRRLESST